MSSSPENADREKEKKRRKRRENNQAEIINGSFCERNTLFAMSAKP